MSYCPAGSRTSPAGVTGALADTVRVVEFDPPALPTVKVTVNVPAVLNEWAGFWDALVPPSPKVQDQDVGLPVEASVNWMDWLTVGDAGLNEKEAVGAEVPPGWVEEPDEPDDLPPHAATNIGAAARAASRILR